MQEHLKSQKNVKVGPRVFLWEPFSMLQSLFYGKNRRKIVKKMEKMAYLWQEVKFVFIYCGSRICDEIPDKVRSVLSYWCEVPPSWPSLVGLRAQPSWPCSLNWSVLGARLGLLAKCGRVGLGSVMWALKLCRIGQELGFGGFVFFGFSGFALGTISSESCSPVGLLVLDHKLTGYITWYFNFLKIDFDIFFSYAIRVFTS